MQKAKKVLKKKKKENKNKKKKKQQQQFNVLKIINIWKGAKMAILELEIAKNVRKTTLESR